MALIKPILIAGLLSLAPIIATAQQTIFPRVDIADLNGREVSFPDQLPGDPTLVLVAFKRNHQDNLNVWIEAMDLTSPTAPTWIEMPVIANYGAIWRGFIDNGMRSGITKTEDRAKVFTVYVSPDRFRSFFNMPSDEVIYLMVVEQNGDVRQIVKGDHTAEKEATIRQALQ